MASCDLKYFLNNFYINYLIIIDLKNINFKHQPRDNSDCRPPWSAAFSNIPVYLNSRQYTVLYREYTRPTREYVLIYSLEQDITRYILFLDVFCTLF